jgi:hypothetical protein
MPATDPNTTSLGGLDTTEAKTVDVPSHGATNAEMAINEKTGYTFEDAEVAEDDGEIKAAPLPLYEGGETEKDNGSEDVIIITGADASKHLLPIRDDFDPALTFRSLFLATLLSGFQAVMTQIYNVSVSPQEEYLHQCSLGPIISPGHSVNITHMLTLHPVQTDFSQHPGHFHRPHSLLSRQGVGQCSPPW